MMRGLNFGPKLLESGGSGVRELAEVAVINLRGVGRRIGSIWSWFLVDEVSVAKLVAMVLGGTTPSATGEVSPRDTGFVSKLKC